MFVCFLPGFVTHICGGVRFDRNPGRTGSVENWTKMISKIVRLLPFKVPTLKNINSFPVCSLPPYRLKKEGKERTPKLMTSSGVNLTYCGMSFVNETFTWPTPNFTWAVRWRRSRLTHAQHFDSLSAGWRWWRSKARQNSNLLNVRRHFYL